jgi:hypothetical protein
MTARDAHTDLPGFGLVILFLFFLVFNVWALIMHCLTKRIERLWLRELLFYLSLFLWK